jgi:hypothetical protein
MRLTTRVFIPIAGIMALAAIASHGRAQQSPSHRQQVRFSFAEAPLEIGAGGTLKFLLSDLPANAEWILAVRAEPRATPQLKASIMTMGSGWGPRLPKEVKELPQSMLTITRGTVRLSGLGVAQGSLLLFATVPPGISVQVDAPSGTVLQGMIVSGLLAKNGEILPAVPRHAGDAIAKAMLPLEASERLVQVSSQEYSAPASIVRRHLERIVMPEYPAGIVLSDAGSFAAVLVRINDSGEVTGVQPIAGNQACLAAVTKAVLQWKLRPFEHSGKPVPAQANLLFHFKDGGVVSSVTN